MKDNSRYKSTRLLFRKFSLDKRNKRKIRLEIPKMQRPKVIIF